MKCSSCGAKVELVNFHCPTCGAATDGSGNSAESASRYPLKEEAGHSSAERLLMPVGRSGYAIAAGYLGLLSLVVLPGPLAVIFGYLGIRDIRKHPEKYGMGRCIFGIAVGGIATLLMISIAVSAIFG